MNRKTSAKRRSGVILLVVISLLALFAAVGLSFVFYADSESSRSAAARQKDTAAIADVDAELLLAFFLNQMIHSSGDVLSPANINPFSPTSPHGLYSSLRPYGLGRGIYGYNPVLDPATYLPTVNPNTFPFSGTGKAGLAVSFNAKYGTNFNVADLVNLGYCEADGFILDPERTWDVLRTDPRAPLVGSYVGWNAPYTYPDANNMFLGVMNANGEILAQSFHRPWLAFGPMDPANPNWQPVNPQTGTIWPWMKYLTMRPHRSMHPFFPLPADKGGDVKNIDFGLGVKNPDGTYSNNDSPWINGGFPIMTAPDGRKYTALVAPFIMSLAGKVDLNSHGNILGTNGGIFSTSKSGLGPWEINPGFVLAAAEYPNLFFGNGSTRGRFGLGNASVPGVGGSMQGLIGSNVPGYQGALTLTASQSGANAGSQSIKYLLPNEAGNPNSPLFSFPYFPPTSYGTYGGNSNELTNHPALFNYFNPTFNGSGNRIFRASESEALLRYGGTGSPSLNSDLFRLFFGSLQDPTARRLLTTASNIDINLPGAFPFLPAPVVGPVPTPYNGYQLVPPNVLPAPYPTGVPLGLPLAPTLGEFDPAGWTYNNSLLRRINLNRPLPAYPAPNGNTGLFNNADLPAYNAALASRQQLAQDIFNVFLQVTMGISIGTNNLPIFPAQPLPTDPNYPAMQWLAQLSVNMVDYIDSDNNITPFQWNPNPNDPYPWVFGTELPRLVINEAYVEVDNTQTDLKIALKAGATCNQNMWVELVNPLMADPSIVEPVSGIQGAVLLEAPGGAAGSPIYKLAVNQNFTGFLNGQPIAPLANLGVASYANQNMNNGAKTYVPPGFAANGTPSNQGFYVVGPSDPFPGGAMTPNLQTTAANFPAMTLSVPSVPPVGGYGSTNFYLQRLACPALQLQPNPALPNYNPYVTVDYVTNIPSFDNRAFDVAGLQLNPATQTFTSWGKKQPYAGFQPTPATVLTGAAATSQIVAQLPKPQLVNQPQHTFGTVNQVNGNTFVTNWLVHLDRQLTSPMELLHVSGYRPEQLTQLFMGAAAPYPNAYGHQSMPAWFDPNARIFRALEFFSTPSGQDASGQFLPALGPNGTLVPATDIYGQALPLSGRVPGKMNLNDIWDPQAFQALCDAQSNLGTFTQPQVDAVFQNLMQSRSPSGMPGPVAGQAPAGYVGPTDNPFMGMAAAGVDSTLLRGFPNPSTTTNPVNADPTTRLFGVPTPSSHPYTQMELLNKIYNNTTSRSNIFAMWLTVGFFNVTDGPLSYVGENGPVDVVTSTPVANGWVQINTNCSDPSNTILGIPWQISKGCCVWVGSEPVIVTEVQGNSFSANFVQPHLTDKETISMKGVLGQEVGFSEGRHVRHRMFAIVDRSALSIPSNLTPTVDPIAGQTVQMPTPAIALPQAQVGVNYNPPNPTVNVLIPAGCTMGIPVGFNMVNAGLNIGFNQALATVTITTNANGPTVSGNCGFYVPFLDANMMKVGQMNYTIAVAVEVTVEQIVGVAGVSYPAQAGPVPIGPSLTANYAWEFQKGMKLTIDPGANQETVQVLQVNQTAPNTITAVFTKNHNGGVLLNLPGQPGVVPKTILGNPGPQQRFDHRLNTALVTHYSIIK